MSLIFFVNPCFSKFFCCDFANDLQEINDERNCFCIEIEFIMWPHIVSECLFSEFLMRCVSPNIVWAIRSVFVFLDKEGSDR